MFQLRRSLSLSLTLKSLPAPLSYHPVGMSMTSHPPPNLDYEITSASQRKCAKIAHNRTAAADFSTRVWFLFHKSGSQSVEQREKYTDTQANAASDAFRPPHSARSSHGSAQYSVCALKLSPLNPIPLTALVFIGQLGTCQWKNELFDSYYDPFESVFMGYSNQQVCHGAASRFHSLYLWGDCSPSSKTTPDGELFDFLFRFFPLLSVSVHSSLCLPACLVLGLVCD